MRLRFAGSGLVAKLTPALAHLSDQRVGDPDVVFRVWDSESTATEMPRPPWSWDAYYTRGDIGGFNTDTVRTAYSPGASALSVFDSSSNKACYWVPDAARVPGHESAAPLRILFHWWLESCGLQVVHGAAVGSDFGVLLAGDGGAGKSTTALACLQAGWHFVGDDYCVVEAGSEPRAHSLYSTAKLDDAAVGRLSDLRHTEEIPVAGDGKSILFLSTDYADQVVSSLPIDAVLLPEVVATQAASFPPASPRSAMRALSLSTMGQLPGAGERAWATLAGLLRVVPTFHLDLAGPITSIPDVIAAAAHSGRDRPL